MSYTEFKIMKNSGTYAEMLETYGVARLINEILIRNEVIGHKVTIEDKSSCYSVVSNKPITDEMINGISYFPVLKFIKKNDKTKVPDGIIDYFNYPEQMKILDDFKEGFNKISENKNLSNEQKTQARKELNAKKISEYGEKLDLEFDVYREIQRNPYASFVKLFNNFHLYQEDFKTLIFEILSKYNNQISVERDFKLVDENPTAQQLYNPFQGKGLNKNKANSASMGNLKSNWVVETMKISGALDMMIPQYIRIGPRNYDLKIYVPEFNNIGYSQAKKILNNFRKTLKSSSPVKLDILNVLEFSVNFIKMTPEYKKGKVKSTIKGFHSVYQKDLGQNKAVANISFINTPEFISYSTKKEGRDWIEILEKQRKIISGIEELGSSIQGLQAYRDFLGSADKSTFNSFSKFSFWYSGFLSQELSKEKFYVTPFKTNSLNKFYKSMDTKELNLTEIINNEGFIAIATAIRRSTISLQYTPKDQRKFEIRYGLAQQLQNKSKSKADLATFIGEFVALYNSETGRYAEKNDGRAPRATVKDSELMEFYKIIDKNPPRLIGALLSSYGFALTSKDRAVEVDKESTEVEETENLK